MPNTVVRQALPTPEALRPWVAGIGALSVDGGPTEPFAHLPETATKVIVRTGADGVHGTLVVGPRARALYRRGGRHVRCTEVLLTPGTVRPLLGVSAVELAGRAVALADLPGAAAGRLARDLGRLGPAEAVAGLAEVLPERLAADSDGPRTELLRAGVAALSVRAGHPPGRVSEVARELAVSERQLRYLFAEGVGLSPKHFARITRLRAVLDGASTASWAELAAATGYFDQAHLSADFRTLMGVPPRSYVTGRLPTAALCPSSGPR
ncbi:AraC family transcriptional regulator [Streptomyces griseoviridis]|uniref:AraC family transcriptional regulator n=1 Tax=Streptomyces griseoviridis TaxID=45398 RepID=A0A3S9Z8J1_STRGD|nr:helix-turn-helix domain-containing protein [Streptomyces griseoviridis]AZS84124.1 AraC family transcriptional regulator [Streptomyces griseoviridis]QCN89024.1 AraC family transcriptional regulator [Streptomyces griseoviridis]